jgi:hypothetical protein
VASAAALAGGTSASKPTFRFGTAATAASGSTTSTATATGVTGGAAPPPLRAVAAAAQDFPNSHSATDARFDGEACAAKPTFRFSGEVEIPAATQQAP